MDASEAASLVEKHLEELARELTNIDAMSPEGELYLRGYLAGLDGASWLLASVRDALEKVPS